MNTHRKTGPLVFFFILVNIVLRKEGNILLKYIYMRTKQGKRTSPVMALMYGTLSHTKATDGFRLISVSSKGLLSPLAPPPITPTLRVCINSIQRAEDFQNTECTGIICVLYSCSLRCHKIYISISILQYNVNFRHPR